MKREAVASLSTEAGEGLDGAVRLGQRVLMVKPVDAAAWEALLTRQHGAVSLSQCRSHGISGDAVTRAIGRAGWARHARGVCVVWPGAPSPQTRVWAALLSVGGLVTASHETALWLDGVVAAPAVTHIAVLDGREVTPRPNVVVHHLPDLSPDRVLWHLEPPRTRIEATVLDVVHQTARPEAVIGLVTSAVNKRATSPERLLEATRARPRLRHRDLVEEMLALTATGALSPLEVRDAVNARAHGLPAGTRQAPRLRAGRVEVVDLVYDEPGMGRVVIKELDGWLGHGDAAGRWRDMDRDNAAEARGEGHLRYGWRDLVSRPCAVAAQVAAVLTANGWPGHGRPCSPTCAGFS